MLSLKKIFKDYHDKARSFSELLPWMAQITPDVTINKDGSLLLCYEWAGVDLEGMLPVDVDKYTHLAEHGLRVFDERIIVWSTTIRRRTQEFPEGGEFTDRISSMINERWKEKFHHDGQYINKYYFSVLYTPPGGAQSFFEKVAYHSMRGKGFASAALKATRDSLFKKANIAAQIEQLDHFLQDLYNKLSGFEQTMADLGMRRLIGDEARAFYFRMSNPASEDQTIVRSHNFEEKYVPAYLDSYLCTNTLHRHQNLLEFRGTGKPKFAAAISIKDWPGVTYPGIWDLLTAVPGEITISQCFRYCNSDEATKYISDKERNHRNMAVKFMAYLKQALTGEEPSNVDEGRMMLADDAAQALAEKTLGKVFGYYNMTLVAYGDSQDEVEQTLLTVSKVLRERGFLLVREGMHLLSAWTGTMPGQWAYMVRWYFAKAANLADLLPLRTLHLGNKKNEHLSEQSGTYQPALTVLSTEFFTPFYFSFHVGDLAHTLVVGPAGTGKSSLLNFLVSQFRKHHPCNIFIFDKDKSCRISTLIQGGQFIDLASEDGSRPKLNPLKLLEKREAWRWIAKWLEIPLTARGYKITSDDDKRIWECLESIASHTDRTLWTLSSLARLLPSHLAAELSQWVGDGKYAEFFDNAEDSFELSDFTCCEMGKLLQFPDVAAAFLEYAFYRISESLDGRPTLIEIEEAWFMIGHPIFGPKLDDWLRTLRKMNAFVIMATQSLEEIEKSPIFSSIITNIPNRIYLPNSNALAYRDTYINKFNLNDAQLQRIRTAIPKRDYYFTTADLSRMVVGHFPSEIMACTRSDKKAQAVFTKYYEARAANINWQLDYINEMVAA